MQKLRIVDACQIPNLHEDQEKFNAWRILNKFEPQRIYFIGMTMCVTIQTLSGDLTAESGDWIVHDRDNGFFPCKKDNFDKLYSIYIDDNEAQYQPKED